MINSRKNWQQSLILPRKNAIFISIRDLNDYLNTVTSLFNFRKIRSTLTIFQTYHLLQTGQKPNRILATGIALLIATNVLLDFSFTRFHNSSFYISESLLFSSYWLLFLPLLMFAGKTMKSAKLGRRLLIYASTVTLHLLLYPALVWLISKAVYEHTFDYWQTFNFALSAYFIKTVLIYGFLLLTVTIPNRKAQSLKTANETEAERGKQHCISSILVSEGSRKIVLQLTDILYFSANTPYISIHHISKTYLHSETLKSLETQLDNSRFVRIHKSHIVNIDKISSIRSRQNGDYDITLTNDAILRLSRSYAKNFHHRLARLPQLTTK